MTRIVLFSNEQNNIDLISEVINDCDLVVSYTKEEIIESFKVRIDLAIIDLTSNINMESLEYLKNCDFLKLIPTLVLSKDESESIKEALKVQAFDYLFLPINKVLLQAKINNILKARNLIVEHDNNEFAELCEKMPIGFGVFHFYSRSKIELIYLNDCYYSSIDSSRENRKHFFGDGFISAVHLSDVDDLTKALDKAKGALITTVDFRVLNGENHFIWMQGQFREYHSLANKKIVYASFTNIDYDKKARLRLDAEQRVLQIANKNGNVTIWLFNIAKREITSGLNLDGTSDINEIVQNVPESLLTTGYVYKDDEQVLLDTYYRIINGANKSECLVRLKNFNTDKFGWRHITISTIEDNEYGDRIACCMSTDVDMQYEMKIQYQKEVKLRQDLLKKAVVYHEINLTQRVIEKHKSKYVGDVYIEPYSKIDKEIAKSLRSKIHPDDLPKVKEITEFTKLISEYKQGTKTVECIYRRLMPNNKISYVKATISLLSKQENDDVMAYVYIDDINEEHVDSLAMNSIIDKEVRSIGVINTQTGIGHLLRDYDHLFAYDIKKPFDYDSYVRGLVNMRLVPEEIERCESFFRLENIIEELKNNSVASLSFKVKKEDQILRKTVIAIYLDDSHNYIVISLKDTTKLYEEEQKKKVILEQAVIEAIKANNAKSEFISRISHDMRTPLNAVIGLINLAREENNFDVIQKYLQKIDDASHFLLGLINDILDLNRIESGKIELREEPYSLSDFTRNIDTVIRPLMNKKNIKFIFNMGCGADNIIVDKMRFCQIFFNLLSNAAKFTEENGVVEFSAEHIPNDALGRHGMRYHVIDNGRGMGDEFQKKLFEPFTQENNDSNSSSNGSGLGLSIVKKLVDIMGGRIKCISKLGVGTEFIIDLYAFFEKDSHYSKEKEVFDFTLLNGLHVLLVEDNEVNTIVAKTLLEKELCIVETCANGVEAITKFRSSGINYYDVILMDIRMPIMNGIEAAKIIRALDRKDAKKVIIIALTADAFITSSSDLSELMNAYITKPIEAKVMYSTILNAINVETNTKKNN